mmetsp:Transcript_8472/g.27007  ORF Transcript_8472/g.27007 Transcript_8472/m.27007 type:complete len:323 (-) Transcript_8472:905-1873(-)
MQSPSVSDYSLIAHSFIRTVCGKRERERDGVAVAGRRRKRGKVPRVSFPLYPPASIAPGAPVPALQDLAIVPSTSQPHAMRPPLSLTLPLPPAFCHTCATRLAPPTTATLTLTRERETTRKAQRTAHAAALHEASTRLAATARSKAPVSSAAAITRHTDERLAVLADSLALARRQDQASLTSKGTRVLIKVTCLACRKAGKPPHESEQRYPLVPLATASQSNGTAAQRPAQTKPQQAAARPTSVAHAPRASQPTSTVPTPPPSSASQPHRPPKVARVRRNVSAKAMKAEKAAKERLAALVKLAGNGSGGGGGGSGRRNLDFL